MDILAEAQRRAFSLWLRTGRLPDWLKAARAEFKFNPWHDPDDGRFTFAGSGRYFGRGSRSSEEGGSARHSDERRRPGASGGGGGAGEGRGGTGGGGWGEERPFGGYGGGETGGAGASGKWLAPQADPPPRRTEARPARLEPQPAPRATPRPAKPEGGAEKDWQEVERNGYVYSIDTLGRTRKVRGDVKVNDAQPRSRTAQAQAGGPDRRAGDDGGHYIARRFNGPTDAFNHFAQDANFNRGSYRSLEDQWAAATRLGKRVEVEIIPSYRGSSQRPSTITVRFWINGRGETMKFPNERAERPRAK